MGKQLQSSAGSVYAPLVDHQLEVERNLKASLEQRGVVIVTTSGTLVSLVFGFSALANKSIATLPHAGPVTDLLTIALLFFLLSTVAAIVTNTAWTYKEFDEKELARLCGRDYWVFDDTVEAARAVSEAKVGILKQARKQNERKARALSAGFQFEVAAIACIGLAVVVVLNSH
jgi:hypothetical protein